MLLIYTKDGEIARIAARPERAGMDAVIVDAGGKWEAAEVQIVDVMTRAERELVTRLLCNKGEQL
jgi:hypothetical protein